MQSETLARSCTLFEGSILTLDILQFLRPEIYSCHTMFEQIDKGNVPSRGG